MNTGAKFDSKNVSKVSGANVATMKKVLKGNAMETYASAFVKAEKTYGVNAIFLASIVAQESGWGTSPAARNNNNMSGTYINGKLHSFSSKTESILFTAKNLSENYLKTDGQFYSGKSVQAVNTRYCLKEDGQTPMYSWSTNVTSISRGMVEKIKKK